MSLLVLDASVVTAALYPSDPKSDAAAARLRGGHALYVCAHTHSEVLRAVRNLGRIDPTLSGNRVDRLIDHLHNLPLRPTRPDPIQSRRVWELRHNLSAYDALYVALAEEIGGSLVTGDAKLAAATGPRCPIELIT
jgi:predicted nucleic acid-binding protein